MEFVESLLFTRQLHELAGRHADEVLRSIEQDLIRQPEKGVLVPGLGGIRKARVGKSRSREGKTGRISLSVYLLRLGPADRSALLVE